MVFNATFNNSSIISWQSVLLVEETRKKNSDRPQVTDKPDHIIYASDIIIYRAGCGVGVKLTVYSRWLVIQGDC
jgi:hypothetical protein